MSLRVLCREVIHPEVYNFIKSTTKGTVSEEVMEKLSAMSRTFFRDSVQQYVKSVEPVIVSQCCDMVKSYFSGIQEARVNIPHDSLMLVSPSAQHGTPNARQSSQHSEHMGNHNEDTVLPEACTDSITVLSKSSIGGQHNPILVEPNNIAPAHCSPASRTINDVVTDILTSDSAQKDVELQIIEPRSPSTTVHGNTNMWKIQF